MVMFPLRIDDFGWGYGITAKPMWRLLMQTKPAKNRSIGTVSTLGRFTLHARKENRNALPITSRAGRVPQSHHNREKQAAWRQAETGWRCRTVQQRA